MMRNQDHMSDKIAIYLPFLHPGGAERVMVHLANGLSERGHNIELVVGCLEGEFKKDIIDSVKIRDLDSPHHPAIPNITPLFTILNYLNKEDPKVLISSMKHVNNIVLLAHKLSNSSSSLVVTEHNDPVVVSNSSTKNNLIYKLSSYTYEWADEIIAVSEGVANNLSEITNIPRGEIEVIYNPVVTEELLKKADRDPEHPWLQGDKQVIVNVGRLTEQKNQELLIKAFSELNSERDFKLIIIGKGEKEDELHQFARQRGVTEDFEIINWVDNPYTYMSAADAFVLTSKWEGLPTVLIEALACDCPVVSSDCPSGPREILCDGEYGTLVETYDPRDFARAIERVTKSNQEIDRQSRAMDFTPERCIKGYERVISKYINI